MKKIQLLILTAMLLTACAGHDIEQYTDMKPRFEPETFFDGSLTAHGVVRDRGGNVIRSFNATINAWWEGNIGYLDEVFIFNDGERQTRLWKLVRNNDGTYVATAGDVIGDGVAEVAGNAFNLNYVLEIQYNDSPLQISVDDWMWLIDDRIVINHSVMKKFGVRVGEIQLTIIRQEV